MTDISEGMESKLYAAVKAGDAKVLTKLQDTLNILQEVTPTGNTALHLAAHHGHVQVVKMLLELMNRDIEAGNQASGEFLTAENEEDNTAFHEAAIEGHYKVIEVLLELDSDLQNMINGVGETALFKAAEAGHKKIVMKLLPLTSSQYDRRTSDGQTLVQCAVYNKHKGVLKKLIVAKPDLLQQTDNLGRTPLHNIAYLDGISQIAKILLEKDKSLCYKVDHNNQLALHIAVKEGNVDLVREILKYAEDCIEIVDNDKRNALHLVIENAVQIFERISRRIKTLVLLVVSKKLINKVDNKGKTPLDIAIDNMDSDERLFNGIKWLLEINGARRNPKVIQETSEHSSTAKKSTWKVQIISVNAVLIATVAFAAAFTLPKEDKKDQLYRIFFQVIVISDALAFCSSISSAILLMYALYGKQEDPLLLNTSLIGLWIALISLLLAFGTCIFMVVAPNHMVVAVIVLAMVSISPIFIRIMILRSKKYIFREDEYYLWTFSIVVVTQNIFFVTWKDGVSVMAIVVIGVLIGRRRYLWSKEKISRGDGNYIWFFIWFLLPNLFSFFWFTNFFAGPICGIVWMIGGTGMFIGQRIYFRSKQKISRDDDHYTWFLVFIIGLIMHVITLIYRGHM